MVDAYGFFVNAPCPNGYTLYNTGVGGNGTTVVNQNFTLYNINGSIINYGDSMTRIYWAFITIAGSPPYQRIYYQQFTVKNGKLATISGYNNDYVYNLSTDGYLICTK
jgi:hypothetical protein